MKKNGMHMTCSTHGEIRNEHKALHWIRGFHSGTTKHNMFWRNVLSPASEWKRKSRKKQAISKTELAAGFLLVSYMACFLTQMMQVIHAFKTRLHGITFQRAVL